MLRYSISSCLLSCLFWCSAQESKPVNLSPKDAKVYKQPYGLRVGIDLSRILNSFFDEDYTGFEVVADYRLSQKLYLAGELGNETKEKQEDVYNFTTSGSYIKAGVDYNTYGNWYGEQNMITIGGRYAVSSHSQTVNNYQIFETSRYWSPENFVSGSETPIEFGGRAKTWIELVVGMKMQLFKNLYLGGSLRLAYLFSDPQQVEFWDLFIPGFNKVTDNSRFGVGYNYSISYLIPLYKKAEKVKKKPLVDEEQ